MNIDKLTQAFANGLHIDSSRISDNLAYNTIPEWDSVAHMSLIAEIERTFDIMMDTNDIVDLSSFGKAKEILANRYNISV